MSLSYNEMYNIAGGIYFAFSSKEDKRLLTINHPAKKREKMKEIFPYKKYEVWTKENFVSAILYLNFVKSPSSLFSLIEMLRDLDEKEVFAFKNQIISYKKYFSKDIQRILQEEGSVDINYMLNEYRLNKIKWYTLYFYMLASEINLDSFSKSRINSLLIKKIKKLLLYVTFSENSKELAKMLLKEQIKI